MPGTPARILPTNFHSHDHGTGRMPPWLLLAPAYSVLPLIRWPLGYHITYPLKPMLRTGALSFLPLVFWMFWEAFTDRPVPDHAGHLWFVGFLLASLVASCVAFARRAIGRRHGEEVHSLEAGFSALAHWTQLPLPLTEQLLVPLLVAGLGWCIARSLSLELGWWLELSGASLLVMARWEYLRRWSQQQATVDDMIRARTYGERLDRHEAQARGKRAGSAAGASTDYADLADGAEPPDMAGWKAGSDNVTPDYVAWFRARRNAPGNPSKPSGSGPDFADLG